MSDKNFSVDEILAELDTDGSDDSAMVTSPSFTDDILEALLNEPETPLKKEPLNEINETNVFTVEKPVAVAVEVDIEPREKEPKPKRKPLIKFPSKENKADKALFNKAKKMPKPLIEDIDDVVRAPIKEVEITPYKGTEAQFSVHDESADPHERRRRKNIEDTDNIEIFDDRYKPPKFSDTMNIPSDTRVIPPINREKQLKLLEEQTILKTDKQLEHHDDIIDGINPYEVIKKARKELSDIDIGDMEFGDLSGDTQGVVGDDLKQLASKVADKNQAEHITEEVGIKTYQPPEKKKKEDFSVTSIIDSVSDDTAALLGEINHAIKEREVMKKNTLPIGDKREIKPTTQTVTNVLTPQLNDLTQTGGSIPLNALNIDYQKQVLKDTTLVPQQDIADVQEKAEKLETLGEKRKRKIKSFMLEDLDDDDEYEDEEEVEEAEDFDGYDASEQIWEELRDSHRALNFRFFVLFIITGFLAVVTFCNDFGINLAYRVFGFDFVILDRRFEPIAHIVMQLVVGLMGLAVCKGVLVDGIKKLFLKRGDCDGICAASSLMATVGTAVALADPVAVKAGEAHIYIVVGMGALLFNTIGKLMMIRRAKHNFRFVAGDGAKYYGDIVSNSELADAFTKGVAEELPVLCTMRKTEFLSDFLKSSYCNDVADATSKTLTPIAFLASLLIGFIAFFFGIGDYTPQNNIVWSSTVCVGAMSAFSSFSIMLAVNNPFRRALKQLEKNDSVVLGYDSAMAFSAVNSVLVDARLLFPAGCVAFRNIKLCQNKTSLARVSIDEAIITAASLAIESGSILSSMFYDMVAGKKELLYDVEELIYEVNMGINGWIGSRRILLGNRKQMERHSVEIGSRDKERKYTKQNCDVVYLAIGGEAVAMFFIEVFSNPEIKRSMQKLYQNNTSVVVRSCDSLITVAKIADVFDIPPDKTKILNFNLHEKFEECTKYTSRGRGDLSCNGTFTSLATALITAKKLVKDISYSIATVVIGSFLALILGTLFMMFVMPEMFSATTIIGYNLSWLTVMLIIQTLRKYRDG
ncbi:MAG: hypothetical protein FWH05_01380 [Oscillospiraceae bacterium]|nr:hypothetical protein [Oscillospiraceae bacterium]